jgi:RNA-binding protein
MSLQGFQRRHLRAQAHPLRPIVKVGRNGLGAGLFEEVEVALDHHELIKVRLAGERDERQKLVLAIAARSGCEVVGVVGGVATLYRRQADPERRRVTLPTRAEER